MTQEKIDRFFKRNDYESVKLFVDGCNEFNDEYCLLVSVIGPDWEYGYGDYTFKYDMIEKFVSKCPEDVRKWGDPEDIEHLSLDVLYGDGFDEERIEIDEI